MFPLIEPFHHFPRQHYRLPDFFMIVRNWHLRQLVFVDTVVAEQHCRLPDFIIDIDIDLMVTSAPCQNKSKAPEKRTIQAQQKRCARASHRVSPGPALVPRV